MSNIYASLQRLRVHSRKEAHQQVRAAEIERDRAAARLLELREGVASARAAVDPRDAEAVNLYATFRLREALRERREEARLAQRERDLEARRAHHLKCVRDELTLNTLVDELNAREAQEARRVEARRMDEIANRPRSER
jgi:hypothetical protein